MGDSVVERSEGGRRLAAKVKGKDVREYYITSGSWSEVTDILT